MARDPRYSTSAWQRIRRQVLARDGGICMIQGPRCTGIATSVHHRVPSSEAPGLFWAAENLVSACGRCNYSDGSRIAAARRQDRLAGLEQAIVDLQMQVAQLREQLQSHPVAPARRTALRPAIY